MADPISNADLKAIWSRNELAARKTPSGRPSKREAKMTIVEFDAVFARLAENDATIATLRARIAELEGKVERTRDCLPTGHTVLEAAEFKDGRVAQTVRIDASGEEYERIVSGEEAYGAEGK